MAEHRMILDAIGRRSPQDAADLYRVHTRHTRVGLSGDDPDLDGPES